MGHHAATAQQVQVAFKFSALENIRGEDREFVSVQPQRWDGEFSPSSEDVKSHISSELNVKLGCTSMKNITVVEQYVSQWQQQTVKTPCNPFFSLTATKAPHSTLQYIHPFID